MTSVPTPTFTKEMLALQQAYLKRLSANLAELRRFQQLFNANHASMSDIQQFYRLSHNFAGSGATFGFPDISKASRSLHHALDAYTQSSDHSESSPHHAAVVNTLEAFIDICRACITKAPEVAAQASHTEAAANRSRSICVYAEDVAAAAPFATALNHAGYHATVTDDPSQLTQTGLRTNLVFTNFNKRNLEKISKALQAAPSATPLIIVASDDAFDMRLAAVRLGAHAYFTDAVKPQQLIATMEHLHARFASSDFRILIVDDDDMLSEFYSHALKAVGMEVITASNPKQAYKLLAGNRFDVALIDCMLPQCSGQELASLIRQHELHADVPVIFMSAKETIELLQSNNSLTGDDFLVKPFTPEQLIELATLRARRGRELAARLN